MFYRKPKGNSPRKSHRRNAIDRYPCIEALERREVLSGASSALGLGVFQPVVTAGAGSGSNQPPAAEIAHKLIGLDKFTADKRFEGIDGSGMAVVVIDSGIDRDHPAFGPDGDQDGIADRLVYSYDFSCGNDDDVSDFDLNSVSHGTHVASIIGSQDATYPGLAPGVDLVHLKVLMDPGTESCSNSFTHVKEALEWVVDNVDEYNIVGVNLSIEDKQNYNEVQSFGGISDKFKRLVDEDVIVVSAAGNHFHQHDSEPGVAYPAADAYSLSVGAIWTDDFGDQTWKGGAADNSTAADRLVSFSQRHKTLLDVLAPGAIIPGGTHDGKFGATQGTSQAAPHVTGMAVLAQQLAKQHLGRQLTQREFRDLLRATGKSVEDGDDEDTNVTSTGLSFPRADMFALGEAILRMYQKFDFGLPGSPLAADYSPVFPETLYDEELGYGWTPESNVAGRDRGGPGPGWTGDDLSRDLALTTDGTFLIDVPNGTYHVTMTFADRWSGKDHVGIWLESQPFGSVTVQPKDSIVQTYRVEIKDGQLEVRVADQGGINANAIINALEVKVAPPRPDTLRFDFGLANSPVAPGFTPIGPDTGYSSDNGFGWQEGSSVQGRDRGGPGKNWAGDDLTRDLVLTQGATFLVDLEKGEYNVTMTFADRWSGKDLIQVGLEGQTLAPVTVAAPSVEVRTYRVAVADGQLNLHLSDGGGVNANAIINGLEIRRVEAGASQWSAVELAAATAEWDAAYGAVARVANSHEMETPARHQSPASVRRGRMERLHSSNAKPETGHPDHERAAVDRLLVSDAWTESLTQYLINDILDDMVDSAS